MDVGDYVVDGDDDDPDLAVVVHRPDATIADRFVTYDGEERSVAADNPGYSTDEPAVIVAFVDSGLNPNWPDWEDVEAATLYDGAQEHDVSLYTFPESRLTVLDEDQISLRRESTAVDLSTLRERLTDADWSVSLDNRVLVAEKMGEQYRIHSTGEIEGEGTVRGPLENLVQQYSQD